MKKYCLECEIFMSRKNSLPPLPLSPPPQLGQMVARPNKAVGAVKSVTRGEIDKYWRLKKMEEEEHFLAALKAAARIKARALSEEDYERFKESLRDMIKIANEGMDRDNNKELRVGIKDWWTKSKYAYLNQPPATKSMGDDAASKKANSIYTTHKNCSYSPTSSYSCIVTSLGVF